MASVDPNQLGTGKWIPCDMVGIFPTITALCGLLAPHIGARGLGSYQNNENSLSKNEKMGLCDNQA